MIVVAGPVVVVVPVIELIVLVDVLLLFSTRNSAIPKLLKHTQYLCWSGSQSSSQVCGDMRSRRRSQRSAASPLSPEEKSM